MFRGRARRSEYWFAALFLFLASLAATILDVALFSDQLGEFLEDTGGLGIIGALLTLAAFLPSLSILIRRLHDTNRSGWWVLIGLIPLAGAIVLFVFVLLDSDPGENRFGPSPKG
ncbi:MAG: DUF805 domain-containing protein [Pontimonas sp.]|nr:DUF805 domain-containing protein [Pontimonas sp.]